MAKQKILERIPVSFGNVNIGDQTAKLPFKVGKEHVTPTQAEHFLCGARVQVAVTDDSNPDQQRIEGIEPNKLEAICDIGRYSSGPKEIGAGLTFQLGEIDAADLARFAKIDGTITLERIGKAGEKPKEDGAVSDNSQTPEEDKESADMFDDEDDDDLDAND